MYSTWGRPTLLTTLESRDKTISELRSELEEKDKKLLQLQQAIERTTATLLVAKKLDPVKRTLYYSLALSALFLSIRPLVEWFFK